MQIDGYVEIDKSQELKLMIIFFRTIDIQRWLAGYQVSDGILNFASPFPSRLIS